MRPNKDINKPIIEYIVLFEIQISDTRTDYYAASDKDFIFEGKTYKAYSISYAFISENSKNEIDSIQISVSNVTREAQALVMNNEIRGKRVKITNVILNSDATDANKTIGDTYYIDSFEVNEQVVTFNLTTKFDVLGVQLPGRTYTRETCRWTFKGIDCKYAGSATECNKRFARCSELNNTVNFGGFPGIPPKKIYTI